MGDFSAGHISTPEARELIAALQEEIGGDEFHFYPGVSYRHLMVWRGGKDQLQFTPPHDITHQPVDGHLPVGEGADQLMQLMNASQLLLHNHPVNARRKRDGHLTANSIWLWGHGRAPKMPTFQEQFGISGAVISAVDLIKGIGIYAGLDVINVPGATGYIDTNYRGKAEAAIEALRTRDFVYLHVEAPDECGHQGDAALKTRAISDFDARIVGPVFEALETRGEPYRLVVTMDHRTPVSLRGHAADPVPLALLEGPAGALHEEAPFDETCNQGLAQGFAHEWVDALLRR
jgi:2,3-bisphosphoglycerate-independent phosphoglycerate mutase